MSFQDLPSELVTEIGSRIRRPEDLARFFATSKTLRDESFSDELQERIRLHRKQLEEARQEQERLMTLALEDINLNKSYEDFDTNTLAEYIASNVFYITPELPRVLGADIPTNQNRPVMTETILAEWLSLYAQLNDLYIGTDDTIKADELLSRLTGLREGFNWRRRDIMVRLIGRHFREVVETTSNPRELFCQLQFVLSYLRKVQIELTIRRKASKTAHKIYREKLRLLWN